VFELPEATLTVKIRGAWWERNVVLVLAHTKQELDSKTPEWFLQAMGKNSFGSADSETRLATCEGWYSCVPMMRCPRTKKSCRSAQEAYARAAP